MPCARGYSPSMSVGGARAGHRAGKGVDLRQVLREKAAAHRSFYSRLGSSRAKQEDQAVSPEPKRMSLTSLRPPEREKTRSPAGSDEGCPQAPECYSDEDVHTPERPRSRDSVTCYDSGGEGAFDESPEDEKPRPRKRIMSRTILEAQYVECPFNESAADLNASETDGFCDDVIGIARRPSALSWHEDGEEPRVRMVRTPSVVVSDYSDDVHAGITSEELEYFRQHVEAEALSSGRSSCSNLDSRCGSQLSVLDIVEDDERSSESLLSVDPEENKNSLSPAGSDCEDDDSGLGTQPPPKKI